MDATPFTGCLQSVKIQKSCLYVLILVKKKKKKNETAVILDVAHMLSN